MNGGNGARSVEIVSDRDAWSRDLATALREAGFRVRLRDPASPSATSEGTPPDSAGTMPFDLVVMDMLGGAAIEVGDAGAAGQARDVPEPAASQSAAASAIAGAGKRMLLVVEDIAGLRTGFELGAEDCILGSAHIQEIVARCEAILRRTSSSAAAGAEPDVYVDRELWVNYGSRQVWVRGRPAHLTPREFKLLEFLVSRRDETLDHATILESVWDREHDAEGPTEVLKQYIWRLRQKVEADPDSPTIIATVAGEGYRFVGHG